MALEGSINAVTTRGFGIAGGFTGADELVVSQGYGLQGAIVPDASDVRFGVVYDSNNLPDPGDVRFGVVYG